MRRRVISCLSVCLVLCLCLTSSCSRSSETPAQSGKFKVALLSPGPVSDAGWNALGYEGLLGIRDRLGAEVAQIETKSPAEFEEGFRDFARRGFQLVIGHGFEFQEAAATVAPDFPDTVFITTSGNTVRKNVAPIRLLLEESSYLAGMLAAHMSKNNSGGLVGGMEIPAVKSTFLAFIAGAKAVKPDFVAVSSYIGNWEDVGAAKEAALALIQRGADVLFHNADAAGLGVFQAAQAKHVYAFGSNKNQNEVAPDVIVASAVIDIPGAFLRVAQEVKEKKFVAKVEKLGMKDGVVSFAYNPRLQNKIPAEAMAAIDAARQKIIDGSLVVPTAEF